MTEGPSYTPVEICPVDVTRSQRHILSTCHFGQGHRGQSVWPTLSGLDFSRFGPSCFTGLAGVRMCYPTSSSPCPIPDAASRSRYFSPSFGRSVTFPPVGDGDMATGCHGSVDHSSLMTSCRTASKQKPG